jgi:hypothetical protein
MSDDPVTEPASPFDGTGARLRRGGCACGAVRFEVRGPPLRVGTCHCLSCRKATGAVFVTYADWPAEAFGYTGEIRTHDGRSFCPACGTRLFHLSPEGAEIMVGALDDGPSDLTPTREGWIVRREPWVAPVAGAGQFEHDPPKEA